MFITIYHDFASLEMFLADHLDNPNVAILSTLMHYLVNINLEKKKTQ